MTDYPYMVIFPRGNRRYLDVAYVRWYQEDEWALASRRRFETEEEALEYAHELSDEHGIPMLNDQRTLDGT